MTAANAFNGEIDVDQLTQLLGLSKPKVG